MHAVLTRRTSASGRSLLTLGVGILLLWLLYLMIFLNTGTHGIGRAAVTALANVLPLALLAKVTERILKHYVMGRALGVQSAWHGVLALGFSVGWYGAVVLGLAFLRGAQGEGFELIGFSGPAVSWQTFQGLCLYATVASVCYALHGTLGTKKHPDLGESFLQRCLVRVGDDLVPIRTDDIVCLHGAHDYVQLVTPNAKHLVRQTLGEFGQRLDPQRFIRVHRSIVVNLDHVLRIEPVGGGRMRAVLSDGTTVPASRSGTQLLRSLSV